MIRKAKTYRVASGKNLPRNDPAVGKDEGKWTRPERLRKLCSKAIPYRKLLRLFS
jgi:hypothetical protein